VQAWAPLAKEVAQALRSLQAVAAVAAAVVEMGPCSWLSAAGREPSGQPWQHLADCHLALTSHLQEEEEEEAAASCLPSSRVAVQSKAKQMPRTAASKVVLALNL